MKRNFVKLMLVLSFLLFFVFSGAVFAADSEYVVKAVQYSPNSQNLAIGDSNGDVCIYQINVVKTPFPYEPDGRHGGGSTSGPAYTIHMDKNLLQCMHGHKGNVNAIAYAVDGRSIASGGDDNDIIIWDALSTERLGTLKGHTASVLALAYSPDGKYLVSGSSDGTIKIWDVDKKVTVQTVKGEDKVSVTALSFSNDGKYLVSGYSNKNAVVWSTDNMTLPLQPIYKIACTDNITSIANSPNSKKVVIACQDGYLKLFDINTGKELKAIQAHTPGLQAVAYSIDGSFFASAGADKKILLYSIDDGKVLRTISTSASAVYSLSFEPTGDVYLAAGTNDGAHIYNNATGDQLTKITARDKQQ